VKDPTRNFGYKFGFENNVDHVPCRTVSFDQKFCNCVIENKNN